MYRKILPLAVILAVISCDDGASPDPDPDPDPDPVFHTLTVTLSGDGAGSVTSSPAGIACDSIGADGCAAEFEEGTQVTLTASPAAGHAFVAWSDACTGGGSCAITVAADAATDAEFDDPATASQDVGPDGGTVTSTDGRVVLEIPAGALGTTETITITTRDTADLDAPFDTMTGLDGPRLVYEMGPDGLTFDAPITVAVELEDTATMVAGDSVSAPIAVLMTTDEQGAAVMVDSLIMTVDEETGTVTLTGQLGHFSPLVAQTFAPEDEVATVAFGVFGVPDVVPVGTSFDAEARMRVWDLGGTNARVYTDMSVSPVERDFDPAVQTLTGESDYGFAGGVFPYTCVAEGEGLFAAEGSTEVEPTYVVHLGDPTTVRLVIQKPVECVIAPEPVPLAPSDGADDGTAGVVNNGGQVAGRSGGHPAVWLDPTQPPTLLPGHPENANDAGFVYEGSEDLTKLGGVVFDALFGLHAALWEDGVLTLPDVGEDLASSSVTAMSADGRFVAGSSFSNGGENHGWAMVDGERMDPVVPAGATSALIQDINNDGLAAGYYSDADGVHAAAWDLADGGAMVDLPTLPGAGPSSLSAVNTSGLMVGQQTDTDAGVTSGIALVDGSWVVIPPATDIAPDIKLTGVGDNGVIACSLEDFPNSVFRACVVAPGEDPVVLDFFMGANTLPARRGISRDGRFYIGGTDPGTGAYTEGWVLEQNPLACPFCGMAP